MSERLKPILPQVPVEGIAIHIAKAGLCIGDPVEARLMPDGRVGVFGLIRRPILGFLPSRRVSYLGHLGPVAEQILAPALMVGLMLRLRVVLLTPEHLATSGPPEIHVSIWADPYKLAPFVTTEALDLPAFDSDPRRSPHQPDPRRSSQQPDPLGTSA